jgi:23S rRNA-intervening sequence protein
MESYKDLLTAYQKAYDLVLRVYEATNSYPRKEIYGLVSQMRRSAVSLPCNIAEGYRWRSRKEYVQFLHIALGSCSELETLLASRPSFYRRQRGERALFPSRGGVVVALRLHRWFEQKTRTP